MPRLLIISVFISWGVVVYGQEYGLKSYSVEDGLPQSQVRDIVEDNLGYLWVATLRGGIAKFDGKHFTPYTEDNGLVNNGVYDLFIDHNSTIWIGAYEGISHYDGLRFKNFKKTHSLDRDDFIVEMAECRDTLFFINHRGDLGKIYNDSVYHWKINPFQGKKIKRIISSLNKEMILGVENELFYKTAQGYEKIETDFNTIRNIFLVKGVIYVSTEKGIYSWMENRLTLQNDQVKDLVLTFDAENKFGWVLIGNGAKRFVIENNGSITFDKDSALKSFVYSCLIDSEGNTWFGTLGNGLQKYYPTEFSKTIGYNDPASTIVSICRQADGSILTGTQALGLKEYKDSRLVSAVQFKEQNRNKIRCSLKDSTGKIWIGTQGGLARKDPRNNSFTWMTKAEGLVSDSVNSLQYDPLGNLWIGTMSKGVQIFKSGSFKTLEAGASQKFKSALVWNFLYDKTNETMYIGTRNGLFTYGYRDGIIKEVALGEFKNVFLGNRIFRNKYILLTSYGKGMGIFNTSDKTLHTITTKNGLSSNFIFFISLDDRDLLWVGTANGIDKIRLNENLEIIEISHFGSSNGLTNVKSEFNGSFFEGNLKWFVTDDGLYSYQEKELKKRQLNKLHISDVLISHGDYALRDSSDNLFGFYKLPINPKFPYDRNHLTFYFNRVNKSNAGQVQYKYYLENFDTRWSDPGINNFTIYSNVPPGIYSFKVRATDQFGNWDDDIVEYPFTISPPFYKRTAFILLCLVMIIGMIISFIYIRVRMKINSFVKVELIRSEEHSKLRKEIALDFHDELGNHLARIMNYINLLKFKRPDLQTDEFVMKLEDSSKSLVSSTKDFLWTLDPSNKTLQELFGQIKDFGENLFEEKEITFRAHFKINPSIGNSRPEFNRQALLIFKEAMTNSFKHSHAGNVEFTMSVEGEFIKLEFSDDGTGFLVNDIGKMSGLNNMKLRGEKIGGIVYINSTIKKGTKICLLYSLKSNGN